MTYVLTLLHYLLEKPAYLQHAHATSESVSEKRVVVSADLRLSLRKACSQGNLIHLPALPDQSAREYTSNVK